MKLLRQFSTLEQSKVLHGLLGDGSPSMFYHFNGGIFNEAFGNDYYPAYSCAELGVMLLVCDDVYFTLTRCNEHYGEWQTLVEKRSQEENSDGFDVIYTGEGETEAEAKADALIWMIGNGILSKDGVIESLRD